MRRRNYINTNYFRAITDANRAYWFGFLVGDGCMHSTRKRVILTQQMSEAYLVYEFGSIFEQPPYITTRLPGGSYTEHRFQLNSPEVYNDLLNLGLLPRKSSIIATTFSKHIPTHLVRHFARGLLDSDGCVTRTNAQATTLVWTGSLEGLYLVSQHAPGKVHTPKKYSTWMLRYSAKAQLFDIYDWLYTDANIYCRRKRELLKYNMNTTTPRRATHTLNINEIGAQVYELFKHKFYYA